MSEEWSRALRDSLKQYGLGRAAASVWGRAQALRNRKGRAAASKRNGRTKSDGVRSRVEDAVEAGLTVVDRMVASTGDANQGNGKGVPFESVCHPVGLLSVGGLLDQAFTR